MKKRIFFLILLLIFLPIVNASSIGISPTYEKFFFEPGIKKNFYFKIYDSDPNQLVKIYVNGDLAQYTNLSVNTFKSFALVNLSIDLPNNIEVPGHHRLLLGAVEVSDELNLSSGVKGLAAIQVPIDIYVPYPGKYAESNFQIENINFGENTKYLFEIKNLGTEKIVVEPLIEIYEGNSLKTSLKLKKEEIKSKDRFFYTDYINTSLYDPGYYPVIAKFNYGKDVIINSEFRIGQLYVNITDYSNKFETKKVNKFYISIENLWNLPLTNVYSDVSISSSGKILESFRLSFIDLGPFQKANLTGFFDAMNITSGKYIANIKVYYKNQTTYKLAYVYVNNPPRDNTILYIIIGVVIFVLSLILIIVYLILKMRKISKNVKKKK